MVDSESVGAARFESAYLEGLWRLQRLRWLNHTEGARHDPGGVEAGLYQLIVTHSEDGLGNGRKVDVLRHVLQRGLVDMRPDVAGLHNRLDDWSTYLEVPDVLTQSWRRSLDGAMRHDVVALITLRNDLPVIWVSRRAAPWRCDPKNSIWPR
ncbi:MAG: hypothetical protein ACE5GC_04175 [Acidimicrobiia bacterium]